MLKRLVYEVQLALIKWLTRHYQRPQDVAEFMRWYPSVRRSRTEAHRLIKKHFGDAKIFEGVHHDFSLPWEMDLQIRAAYPAGMDFNDAMVRDEAFIHEWCSSPLYHPKVSVHPGWYRE